MGHQVTGSQCELFKQVRSQVPVLVQIDTSKIINVSQSVQLLGWVK